MMQTRRDFVVQSLAATAVLPLSSCSQADMADYEKASLELRAALSANPDILEFIRFATLAPNGHNTQPWRFSVNGNDISIRPDFSRRTSVVDPDDHHLFVSLGCAAENLLLAGAAHSRPGNMMYWDGGHGRVDITLEAGPANASPLYRAIPERQSTRSVYSGQAIPLNELKLLENAARIEGVSVVLITDTKQREVVLDHVIRGNGQQMDDPAFVRELKQWIRFNPAQALERRDGLFGPSSGNPTFPSLIGKTVFGWVFDKESENRKYTDQIRSSSAIAVFTGDEANKDHWVRVGRSFQRLALQATALGIRHAHINQPVEVPKVRSKFADWLGVPGKRPDLVIRLGYAPALPMSLRRPVKDLLIPWRIMS
jgi:hypothetical protein